ncbi:MULTISPECIES: FRG domain-containing protein [Citromicrobium]|jgi:hypothetical protein|uniref:FRG domain-containing protein n=1 Tax=Citromicrobium TaxID=72173 RepID=UPI0009EB92E9|nr:MULTISPECIES: FRG domain-containing protein [Citromicrobium]
MSISSVSEFVEKILSENPSGSRVICYRGHGDTAYKLTPSIFRSSITKENEHILLRELVAAHPEDFHGDITALEMLVRMQHYSLPTRLLDVTFNPLVALYFACEAVKKRKSFYKSGKRTTKTIEKDGHVKILTVPRNLVCYFDSDKVSCITNLARLNYDYKCKINTELNTQKFNSSTPIKRLLHFIRQEKNGFLGEILPLDIEKILLVKPKQNNKRILAQAGAFFAFGTDEEIESGTIDKIGIKDLLIDAGSKAQIRHDLDKLGINEKTLFPEIERAARYITGTLEAEIIPSL